MTPPKDPGMEPMREGGGMGEPRLAGRSLFPKELGLGPGMTSEEMAALGQFILNDLKRPLPWKIARRLWIGAMEAFSDGFDMAHEPAKCGHARVCWRDPKFGTPEYKGHERCEVCTTIATLDASLSREAALRSEVAGLKGLLGECRDALIEGQTAWQRATIVGRIDKALGKGE